jgi:4a-hydroxytetrahydrobiopterin dehydratase
VAEKKCEMCRPGMPVFSEEQIAKELETLEGWAYCSEHNVIYRTFEFKGFYKTMAFVNAVAWIANQQAHHPDMSVSYNKVVIHFQTHEAGGITQNDIICAKLVNALQ